MNFEGTSPLGFLLYEVNSKEPDRGLFHYTSIGSLMKVVESGSLYASDLRYMSDASELTAAADLISILIGAMLERDEGDPEILGQFSAWVRERVRYGNRLFVACFSEEGNLLSQWRSYCPPSKGVSVGFDAGDLKASAQNQQFSLVKCIYDRTEQAQLLRRVIAVVEEECRRRGPIPVATPNTGYHYVFGSLEFDFLRIAAAIKHSSFSEEREWRAVSWVHWEASSAAYREGVSMIVPYRAFKLPLGADGKPLIRTVYVGPTPHVNLAMASVTDFLSVHASSTQRVVMNSMIPYRTW